MGVVKPDFINYSQIYIFKVTSCLTGSLEFELFCPEKGQNANLSPPQKQSLGSLKKYIKGQKLIFPGKSLTFLLISVSRMNVIHTIRNKRS